MSHRISRRHVTQSLVAATTLGAAAPLRAADQEDHVLDARHVMEESAITVEQVRREMRPSPDMDNLLQRSKGVMIVPSFYKAGFILGVAYGDGVLIARLPDGGFSDPAFYRMTAGSLGLQIGMDSAKIVFMILTEKGLSAVLNDEFKLGANASMALGTIGVGAEAATTTNIGKDIVAYSTRTGLFAGGAIEGAVIKPRKDWNAAVYGVGNDNPAAIIQRNQLRAASNVKDALAKSVATPAAATAAEPVASETPASEEAPLSAPVPKSGPVDVSPLPPPR